MTDDINAKLRAARSKHHGEVNIGRVSMLFSSGHLIGVARRPHAWVLNEVSGVERRHQAAWRDFQDHIRLQSDHFEQVFWKLIKEEVEYHADRTLRA